MERALREQADSPSASARIRKQLAELDSRIGRLVDALASGLKGSDAVSTALRDWLGEIRIELTEDGPMAFWRINDEGLLLTAGPRVAKMVAGARYRSIHSYECG